MFKPYSNAAIFQMRDRSGLCITVRISDARPCLMYRQLNPNNGILSRGGAADQDLKGKLTFEWY